MPSLLEIPPELVEQIISDLAEGEPPSRKLIYEQPSKSLLDHDYHPLKDLSCTCRILRRLCFTSLFSALKLNMEVGTGFLEFIKSSQLAGRVDSLVLYTTTGCLGNSSFLWPRMVEVVDRVNAPSMTIIFPPSLFEEILPYSLNLDHAWAFSIDYQVLHLEMAPNSVAPQTPEDVVKESNVFAMRPWTHCTYNEGSSVEAYSTYEYYLKDKPSLFCPSNSIQFVRTMQNSLDHITSLDLITVFPTNHLWSFGDFISFMKSLRHLRTQLAPTPSNNILDDPSSLGKCQTKDLWMEFESSYARLVDFVAGGGYDEFELGALDQFTILDYANAALRETIDGVVGNRLDEWERDRSGGRWTRRREDQKAISQ